MKTRHGKRYGCALMAVLFSGLCLAPASADVRVRRTDDDHTGIQVPGVNEVSVTNLYDDDNDIWIRTVYFLDPYDASKNPEYYIYESGDSYITGVAIALTSQEEDEVISIRFRDPLEYEGEIAASNVGYVRLGETNDPDEILKTRVYTSRISGDIGDLEVVADTTDASVGNRWGTVEMRVEGDVTDDWTFYRPSRSDTDYLGVDLGGDLDATMNVTYDGQAIQGAFMQIEGDITSDGHLNIASPVSSGSTPLRIKGEVNGTLTIAGGLEEPDSGTGTLEIGDSASDTHSGTIEIGDDLEYDTLLQIHGDLASTAVVEIDGNVIGRLEHRDGNNSSYDLDGEMTITGYVAGKVICDDLNGTLDVGLEFRDTSDDWMEFDTISGVLTLNASCPASPANPWQGYMKVGGYTLTPEYYDYTNAVTGGGKIIPNSYRYFDQSPCSGDLDGDGDTDQSDLAILLGAYDSTCRGDLDADGDTDQSDLGILTADYACGT
jgi:hypothetical protein